MGEGGGDERRRWQRHNLLASGQGHGPIDCHCCPDGAMPGCGTARLVDESAAKSAANNNKKTTSITK